MPRIARLIPEYGALHVMCRGNNKRKVFRREKDYKFYYNSLISLKTKEYVKVYHYCLMPNHVHLVVGVDEDSNLSRFMQRVNGKYAYYYKKRYTYVGHLWQDRFKSKIITRESYLAQCGKYVELNPVRASIVEFPQEHTYSSYKYYALGIKDKLVDENPLFLSLNKDFDKRIEIYRDILRAEMRL